VCEHDVEVSSVALASERALTSSASASIDGVVLLHDYRTSGAKSGAKGGGAAGFHKYELGMCPIASMRYTSDGQQLIACTEEGSMAVLELRKLSSASASGGAGSAAVQQLPLVRTGEETRCMWVDDRCVVCSILLCTQLFLFCLLFFCSSTFCLIDDSVALTGGEKLSIYDIKAGRSIGKISGCSWIDGALPSAASALAVDATGQTVAVGHEDGSISVLYNGTRYS